MLAYAQGRPGSDQVTWIHGDSTDLPDLSVDLAVMSGHVVQHIPDPAFAATLAHLRAHMDIGATVAFESRTPTARDWVQEWTSTTPTRRGTIHGDLEEWSVATWVDAHNVEMSLSNRFVDTGETVTVHQVLTFRDEARLRALLEAAGFAVEVVHGTWQGAPFTGTQPVMIVVARAW